MTTITLQEYHDRIEKMIDENMLTDAINHCRHILEAHPSDINTYRLLAKALLEQHDYDGAADLFQRVLSADPNDFVAHVGLSIIRAEESQVETALWHLQRAFEIEPYNPAIQEELRRHYAQFSDMAVDRIPLTSGALARLYIKGELYQQAVQELRHTIQQDQDRVDLEVLLAEALWRNDQRVDAEEVCLNVLQKLPNCIAINAILSEIWLQTGRIGESQKYLRRLIGLTSLDKNNIDMDTAVGRAFRADGAPALPDQVEIEVKGEMDMALAAAASSSAKGPSAEWMSEVTFDSDSGKPYDYERLDVVTESPSGMHNYDWMAEVNDDLAEEEGLPMESEWFMDDSLKDEPSLEDDWLADVEAAAGPTAVADDFDLLFADDDVPPLEPAAGEPENEDWFLTQSESELQADETFASEQSVPEWLAPLVNEPDMADIGQEFEEDSAGSDWFAESVKDESVPDTEGEMPDWLSTLVDDKAPSSGEADFVEVDLDQATAVADEQDEWVIDEHAEDHWDEPDYTEEEMPDWLRKQTGELEGEVVADASGEEMDDWLAEAAEAAAEPMEQEAESGLAGWLSDEPEEVPGMVKGAAALGLTAMFAALDDDVPEAESASAEAEMDELDDLFAEVSGVAGATAVAASVAGDEDDDAWFSALESAGFDEEPFAAGLEEGNEETAVTLDDLRASMADESAADISLDSDWLTLGDEVWDEELVADDLADLTAEPTDLAAEFSQTFMTEADLDDEQAESEITDEEIPDWLLGDAQVRLGAVEATAMGDHDEDEAALPEPEDDFADLGGNWLSDFTLDEDEEPLPDDTELDVTPALEGVPDWLAGFEDDETPEAEMEDEWTSESFAVAPRSMADDESDEEEVPDWLQGVSGESAAMADMGDAEANELFDVLADMSGNESPMADWLADDEPQIDDQTWAFEDELEEAAAKEAVAEETAVPSGGMTAWLNVLPESEPEMAIGAEDVPEIPSEELFATDSENLPDWLSASVDDTLVTEAEDSNLPDWLLDGGADVPAQLDSDDLFGTDDEGTLDVLDELDGLEEGLADDEGWDEEEMVGGLTAVGLTALLSSIDDEPATVADLSTDTEIDWLGEMDEAETGMAMDVADEMALDWLDETEEVEEADTAVAAIAEPDMLDVGDDAPAEELNDAISWLEELASQQETPVEDMPTVAENLLAEELAAAEISSTQMMDGEDLDAAFDDVLDEAFAEAFPDMGAEEAEAEVTAEEAEGDSWLDVLMAEEEAEEAALSGPPTDDPEAAMAWLEGLAAKQGVPLAELPTLQGRDPGDLDHLVDEAQADLDDALAWMDNLAEPETKEEWPELDEELLAAAMSGAAITRAPAQPAVDNELVQALNFLEEQVKAEGITSPVSGGTAVVSDTELMAALDWLEESLDEGEATAVASLAEAEEEEADLLEELVTAEMPDAGELLEAESWEEVTWDWDQPESITDLLTVAAKPIVAKPADDEEDLSVMDMPDDPDEAMEWLARIAADETSEPEESLAMVMDEEWDDQVEADDLEPASAAPDTAVATIEEDFLADTLPEPDDLDFSDMPDDPDEAMNWLLNMAEGDAAIDFDMQPPPITPSEDAAFAVDYGPSSEPEMEVVEEMDTAVASEALAAAEVVAAEMALEDEEDLLAGMLDDDFEIDFDMQPPPITPSEDAAFAVDYGAAETVPSELESEVVEEVDTVIEASAEAETMSPDETVMVSAEEDESWLEGMLDDDFEIDFDMEPPPITPSEDAAFAVDYGLAVTPDAEPASELELEAAPLAVPDEEDILAAVPEDPDEAMAWLQKIANEQSSDLETAVPADDAPLPAWLEIGAADAGESELGEVDEIEMLSETPDEGDLGLLDDLGMDIEDDLADSLPSWLSVDSGRSSGTGQTGWLTSVENIDVFSWLAAEEEATVTGFDEDALPPDMGEARPSSIPASGHLPSLALPESDMPAESFEVQPVTDELDSRQLSNVHEVLAEKKYEEAAQHYQQLIASGTATLGLIAELESLADEYPDQPAFRRLLGDAYMRNGQLQKALNAYRGALDQL